MDTKKRIFVAEHKNAVDQVKKTKSYILAENLDEALAIWQKKFNDIQFEIISLRDTDMYENRSGVQYLVKTIVSKTNDDTLKLWYAYFTTEGSSPSKECHFIYFVSDGNNSLLKLMNSHIKYFGDCVILESMDRIESFLDGQELHEVNLSDVIN